MTYRVPVVTTSTPLANSHRRLAARLFCLSAMLYCQFIG
jgi:hypothetical protein